MDTVVTVDTEEGTLPLVFLLGSDLECFDDRDALCNVKDNVRLLEEPSFNFTTIMDDRCSSS